MQHLQTTVNLEDLCVGVHETVSPLVALAALLPRLKPVERQIKSGSDVFIFPHISLVSATVLNQQPEECFLLTFKIKD